MSRKGLLLLLATGVAWGIPYFFIRIAVAQFDVAAVVLARVVIGASILIPLAIHRGALVSAFKNFKWVLAFAVIEMVIPWFLITHAEKSITSGLAALLIATVPIWGALIAYWFGGDKTVKHPRTLAGLALGFIGVALLVGIDSVTGQLDFIGALGVLIAAIGYAVAPAIAERKLQHIDSSGVIGLSMLIVAIVYAVPGSMGFAAAKPDAMGWLSLGILGLICSSIAFVAFFALIREVGSARATITAYLNTAIAVVIGVLFLSEPLTAGIIIGFPLVLIGSYLASKKQG